MVTPAVLAPYKDFTLSATGGVRVPRGVITRETRDALPADYSLAISYSNPSLIISHRGKAFKLRPMRVGPSPDAFEDLQHLAPCGFRITGNPSLSKVPNTGLFPDAMPPVNPMMNITVARVFLMERGTPARISPSCEVRPMPPGAFVRFSCPSR